ncbi:hypothetical protein BV22DRAFT_1097488, partial [Leucogyrophana mollusca]
MTVTKIIFFDILTTLSVPTSPNTWKVRLALNYKGLSFETRWVETCDIERVCKSLGIPPTSVSPSGIPKYTLPALIDNTFSTPTILSDSTPIIEYLERAYPDPSRALCPPNTRSLEALFEYHINTCITAHLIPLMVMHMYDKKTPRDRAHFRERMEAAFGKRLEDIELQGREREDAWKRIAGVFDLLAFFMEKNSAGEFFTGKSLSLADCTMGGLMLALRYDSPDEAWGKVMTWSNRRWARYMAALEEWVVV